MGFPNILNFFKDHYVKTILIFFIIILIINLFLIGYGHFDAEPTDDQKRFERTPWNTVIDSVYFTTTQLSTIGYGDITAKTTTAKNVCSLVHVFIIIISLKLFSEIGFAPKVDKVLFEAASEKIETDKINAFVNSTAGQKRHTLIGDKFKHFANLAVLQDKNNKVSPEPPLST
jgi:hypothetical protein